MVAMCALARAAEKKMNTKLAFILLVAAHQTYSPHQVGLFLAAVAGTAHKWHYMAWRGVSSGMTSCMVW